MIKSYNSVVWWCNVFQLRKSASLKITELWIMPLMVKFVSVLYRPKLFAMDKNSSIQVSHVLKSYERVVFLL